MPKYPLNGSHYTKEDDLEMMKSPADWPRWPWLPVKRKVLGGYDTAVVYADDIDGPFVIRDSTNTLIARYSYKDALTAVEDGWKVD